MASVEIWTVVQKISGMVDMEKRTSQTLRMPRHLVKPAMRREREAVHRDSRGRYILSLFIDENMGKPKLLKAGRSDQCQ